MDVPVKKREAEVVSMRRMERWGWWERDDRREGSLIVATEPVAARRRWSLVSWRERERRSAGEGEVGRGWLVGGLSFIDCLGDSLSDPHSRASESRVTGIRHLSRGG